jgi:hypothetical protein
MDALSASNMVKRKDTLPPYPSIMWIGISTNLTVSVLRKVMLPVTCVKCVPATAYDAPADVDVLYLTLTVPKICVCVCACVRNYVCVCIYIYLCMYVYIYIYIYI